MNEEKISVLYDDNYLGIGFFIIKEGREEIEKFIKIYLTGSTGFPIFHVRGYERGNKDTSDKDFKVVDFKVFKSNNKELYKVLLSFCNRLNGKVLRTIDPVNQGDNYLELRSHEDFVIFSLGKSIYKGYHTNPDYIDIILGDDYSCLEYNIVQKFYRDLIRIHDGEMKEEYVLSRILK